MSNFSNIGFNVTTEEEFERLLELAYKTTKHIKVNEGAYALFTDSSGAELYMQFNNKNEFLGVNPNFKGKSNRVVCLTSTVERPESELDGAFHCWADPSEKNNPESGIYPFIFDLPDFKTIGPIDFPKNMDIQLSAFAQDLTIYDSEKEYDESETTEPKWASQSFLPSGLFSFGEDEIDPNPPQATAMFTGIIKQFERKINGFTNEAFYWLFVDTLGGEVDIVADCRFFEKEPKINGIVQGQFWLSGQLLNAPKLASKENKTFFQKIFGR